MPETATKWFFGSAGLAGLPPFSVARPPYWTKPVPSSLSAETLNCWPETLNDAAIAPVAWPKTMAPAMKVAGTTTVAKRFHRVRPFTALP